MKSVLRKRMITIVIVMMCIVLQFFLGAILYWSVIHPLQTYLTQVPTEEEHRGASYFTEGEYLVFEDGNLFAEMVDAYPFIEAGKIRDFYHLNRVSGDNPIYGKYSDIFAIELEYSTEKYDEVIREVKQTGKYAQEAYQYVFYVIQTDSDIEQHCAKVFAFCDEKEIIRCILVTEVDKDFTSPFSTLLRTPLEW